MSGAYWGLTSLDLMGRLDDMNADEVVAWLLKCQHDDGGVSLFLTKPKLSLYFYMLLRVDMESG